jgi:hypothetical protein
MGESHQDFESNEKPEPDIDSKVLGPELASVTPLTEAASLKAHDSEGSLTESHGQQLKVLESRVMVAQIAFEEWAAQNHVDVMQIPWQNHETGERLSTYALNDGVELELSYLDATASLETFKNSLPEFDDREALVA